NNNNATTTNALNIDELTTEGKKLSGNATATYYNGFRTDSQSSGAYELFGAYAIKPGSLQVYQLINHLYVKNEGEEELQASDTSLRFLAKSRPLFDTDWTWQYRIEVTLPISQFSQDQDVYSKPALEGRFNKSFLQDRLSISARPFVRRYLNRYTTTVSSPGAGGGRPLISTKAGLTLLGSYSLSDRLSFTAVGGYNEINYEKTKYENAQKPLGQSDFATHQYVYDLSLSYDIQPGEWTATFGYGLDSIVERLGGIEYLTYDDKIAYWYLGATYAF
ncbi:MAG: hypothetical protein KDD34_09265, partial [Bdellovibrionales bacterium]|nr:hypothetical protein [Bdellovibrionales bacterium]